MSTDPEPIDADTLRGWSLPAPGSSKKDRGDVLIIGGARKTPGAVALAGMSALRVGAGRLTLAVADAVAPALAVAFPEAGVTGLPETRAGAVASSAAWRLTDEIDADCIVIGPGLDDADETVELLRNFIPMIGPEARVLLDAYALGALTHDDSLGDSLTGRLALTPNATEAGLLLGREIDCLGSDLLEIADRFGAVVSCQSLIAGPDGALWSIEAGGPGLGTSGSGDVLAGALAGLAARGTDLAEAACWATYLHARAGDRLSERVGPLGFLARELTVELPGLLAELT
ncbi:NAD(P)H-hydrate dehydratase [Amnibacterium flavum]|uniref:NAD(P)H-hydrate dehydratase n=1 Tax=Amnibacterium flavum TaxID=2173173 RepID=UPI001F0CDA1C|nr:NAD(P)H-hydrate dehydratase [Amnibacterium flavum]